MQRQGLVVTFILDVMHVPFFHLLCAHNITIDYQSRARLLCQSILVWSHKFSLLMQQHNHVAGLNSLTNSFAWKRFLTCRFCSFSCIHTLLACSRNTIGILQIDQSVLTEGGFAAQHKLFITLWSVCGSLESGWRQECP